jgi:hypothetical protein
MNYVAAAPEPELLAAARQGDATAFERLASSVGGGTPTFDKRAGDPAAAARHADVGGLEQRARPVRREPGLVTVSP